MPVRPLNGDYDAKAEAYQMAQEAKEDEALVAVEAYGSDLIEYVYTVHYKGCEGFHDDVIESWEKVDPESFAQEYENDAAPLSVVRPAIVHMIENLDISGTVALIADYEGER